MLNDKADNNWLSQFCKDHYTFEMIRILILVITIIIRESIASQRFEDEYMWSDRTRIYLLVDVSWNSSLGKWVIIRDPILNLSNVDRHLIESDSKKEITRASEDGMTPSSTSPYIDKNSCQYVFLSIFAAAWLRSRSPSRDQILQPWYVCYRQNRNEI